MAAGFEQSFTLEDLEISELEQFAEQPYLDNITTCSCRGNCCREKGRNFCPCKSLNNFCSRACHGEDFGACLNNRKVQESDSDKTDSDFSVQESAEEQETGRGRGRRQARGVGRGRGARGGQARGGRGRGSKGGRGRGSRGGQARGAVGGRGRGRGRLVPEENAAQRQADHEEQLVVR